MTEVIYKPDKYTKIVLTVIAACLLFLCINILLTPHTATASKNSVIDVNIKEVGGSYFGSKIPVNIEAISGNSVNGALKVDIEAINNSSIYGSEIPVKIK